MTIPGIGPFSALLITAEIGDIDRFTSPEKLCSYAGLVPTVRQSGETTRLRRSRKDSNKLLRWILVECAWIHIANADTRLTDYYYRKKRQKGSKKAAIATARKMLTAIYHMLERREKFRPQG